MKNNKIVIGGDVSFDQISVSANCEHDLNKLNKVFSESEISIVNLECPITESEDKIDKIGPNIKCDMRKGERLLSALRVSHVTLANNHIMDYGSKGIKDTIDLCRSLNISTLGAGENNAQANITATLSLSNGKKIAVINACEKEFCLASNEFPGAAHFDLINLFYRVKHEKKNHTHVILILHGGHEHYKYVSPEYQRKLRFLADAGASAIISHHTHYATGYETWNGCPIFYSLGNLLFSRRNYPDYWYKGYLVELDFSQDKLSYELIPYKQSYNENIFSFLYDQEKKDYLNEIDMMSKVITNTILIHEEWEKYVKRNTYSYMSWINGLNRFQRLALKLVGMKTFIALGLRSKNTELRLWQLINCESHRELTSDILEAILDDVAKKR